MRYGEMAAFEERPHSPYYGAVDATPLYVILLDEYERWTGDKALVKDLEFEARAAINWIDQYADLMGNGYISYKRRNERTGLENQSWKDSWNSISYADGRLPSFPRATCELQGYAYDAKLRGARLARLVWKDDAYADRLEKEAADLKRRFNRDFWLADRGYYALALDADGSQVDSLASNNGLLLWSGIVDANKAKSVVGHLMGPRMWSGWGVRTLAEGEGRYNPIGYHLGTVWPFDNSFIAWGLRRYGFKEEAAMIASGILDAAVVFEGRLPEAFGGYDRSVTKYPVKYPTACSPQAWSTGAPLLLLRTMLGLEPLGDHLVVDPALPASIGHLELLDIPGRWGRLDAFGRGRVHTHADKRPAAIKAAGRRTAAHDDDTSTTKRTEDEVTAGTNGKPPTSVVIVGGGFAGDRVRARPRQARRHPRHADRQERLPPVPAAAVPGRDLDARIGRHRLPAPQDRGGVRRLRSPSPGGRVGRPRGEVGHDGQRRHLRGRLPRARGRLPAELLQDPGRRARVPALLAGRCRAPADADHRGVRGGGSRSRPRGGRGHRLRHRRRRPDGGRGGRRAVRDDQHDDGPRVSVAGPAGEGPPRRSRQGTAQDVRRQGPPVLGAGAREGWRGPSAGIGRRRDRPGPREAVGRVDHQYALCRVGRWADGGAGGRIDRAAAGSRRAGST